MRLSFLLNLAVAFCTIIMSSADGREPVVSGPIAGGIQDVTNSNDSHLEDVTEFAINHLESRNEDGDLHFVRYKALMQVVSGLKYTLFFRGNDSEGTCQEKHKVVVYDQPWMHKRRVEMDTVNTCT
ncbi:unnamed protein product [Choristocarpus tenellus]